MTNLMSKRARRMRRDMSDAERRLWNKLRELNGQGFHFRQQAPIGTYIADFCDHTAKLVLEVDGAQHGEPKGLAADRRRTRWLEEQGYRVLRFWIHEPLINMAGVEIAILIALGILREDGRENTTDTGSPPTPDPSPRHAEGVPSARRGGGPSPGSWRAARKEAVRKKSSSLKPIVPSPLVGEGQGGGDRRAVEAEASSRSKPTDAGSPPTPSPSPRGGGGPRLSLRTVRSSHHG